jgi:transmembrane sensor
MTVMAMTERDPDLLREASEWFARLDGEELSADDLVRFAAWRRRSPQHERAFLHLSAAWSSPELEAALATLKPVDHKPPSRTVSTSAMRGTGRWKPALAAATVLGLVSLWSLNADLLTLLHADYSTSTGEQQTVHLQDQSSIILNTNTALAASLDGSVRRIRLFKGEALFRVHRDPDRPFIVEYEDTTVRVLGTEFAVRARGHGITVTVVHGAVEVGASGDAASIRHLTDGQQVSAGPDGLSMPRSVDPADLIAWTRRHLPVTNVPLAEVIQEIQRYHAGYVWLWNPANADIRVTGIYDLSNTMETLTVLAKTLPIRMDRLTDHVVILR